MQSLAGFSVLSHNSMFATRQACAPRGVGQQQHACSCTAHKRPAASRALKQGGSAIPHYDTRNTVPVPEACKVTLRTSDFAAAVIISTTCVCHLPGVHHSVRAGKAHRTTQTRATSDKYVPMLHPAGPSKLYPEVNKALEDFIAEMQADEAEQIMEGMLSGSASGFPNTEAVIESPPEWGRPDEGNPNQPRRPPEYQPPQVRFHPSGRTACTSGLHLESQHKQAGCVKSE